MLLHHARRAARTDDAGHSWRWTSRTAGRWDTAEIAEGVAHPAGGAGTEPPGRVPDPSGDRRPARRRRTAAETDWVQILAWYDELVELTHNPFAMLSRAVAVGEVVGPSAGLRALDGLDAAAARPPPS